MKLSKKDLEGLPPELIKELSISKASERRDTIIDLMRENGKTADLNAILIGLHKETGKVFKRTTIVSVLYRMVQSGLISHDPYKRGTYSLKDLPTRDSDK